MDHSCSLPYQCYKHMLKLNHAIRPNHCPSVMVPRRSMFLKRCNQLHAHMLTHNTLQWPLCTYVAPYHSVTRNVTIWCHHYLHNVAASAMYVAASVICLSQQRRYVFHSQFDMSVAAGTMYVVAGATYVAAGAMYVTASVIFLSQRRWYVCCSRCDVCRSKWDMSVALYMS